MILRVRMLAPHIIRLLSVAQGYKPPDLQEPYVSPRAKEQFVTCCAGVYALSSPGAQ
jgi:hypothetical protein